ncbi:arginase family protein [Streptomyces sp. NPDC051664]|uniref:arginase family protein n=1 Tax=Streptomyces sp. NPDC051664 TaxID=3365668 RepID=UPI003793FDD4
MRRIVVIDAPSNGLRPPTEGAVPGCYKLAGALREQRLVQRLGAYEGDGVFNAEAIATYTCKLADRIEHHVRTGDFPVVLGGDCSIQLGASLAPRRIGRYGLAVIDGSADFRHPGNSDRVGAAGGEGLAIATGPGQADLMNLEGLQPYVRDEDVRVFGIRDYDEERAELTELKITNATVGELREWGAAELAGAVLQVLEVLVTEGFWVRLDADVLDPSVMPAVHSPDPGGLMPDELALLLSSEPKLVPTSRGWTTTVPPWGFGVGLGDGGAAKTFAGRLAGVEAGAFAT